MIQRLGRNGKELVRKLCDENILFKALYAPSKEMERHLVNIRLSTEEVFLACMSTIDDIKEYKNVEDAHIKIDGLYNTMYCDLRDASASNVSEEELDMAVGEVVYCVTKTLTYFPGGKYSKLLFNLHSQLDNAKVNLNRFQEMFSPQFFNLGEENIANYVQSYMTSDDYFSDTIRKALKKVKEDEPTFEDDVQEDSVDEAQLDNSQLVILFTELLQLDLDPTHTNFSALAELISRVSGKKKNGLRKRISEGVDYENKKTKNDIKLIISLTEELKPDFAKRLKKSIES